MSDLPVAKKGLGQHWLTDGAALQAMCEAGNVTSDDTVLEIGPGSGTLTEVLLNTGAKVIGVEFDKTLTKDLSNKFGGREFHLIEVIFYLLISPVFHRITKLLPIFHII